jgi:hypothetical protein
MSDVLRCLASMHQTAGSASLIAAGTAPARKLLKADVGPAGPAWGDQASADLNTPSPASFYEAFPPAETKRLADKLEIHHPPQHGSWLNSAQIELRVLARQCLARRLPAVATLQAEVRAWQAHRDRTASTVDWRFTTADARI